MKFKKSKSYESRYKEDDEWVNESRYEEDDEWVNESRYEEEDEWVNESRYEKDDEWVNERMISGRIWSNSCVKQKPWISIISYNTSV